MKNRMLCSAIGLMALCTQSLQAWAAPPMLPPGPPQMMPMAAMAPVHVSPRMMMGASPSLAVRVEQLQRRIFAAARHERLTVEQAKSLLDNQNEIRKAILEARADEELSPDERSELIARIEKAHVELGGLLKQACSCEKL